jgi:hypothetical protein
MCEICHRTPCHPQCPNAEEPAPVAECAWCKEPIYEGDEYYDINGDTICTECIDECKKTAEVEEPDYDE